MTLNSKWRQLKILTASSWITSNYLALLRIFSEPGWKFWNWIIVHIHLCYGISNKLLSSTFYLSIIQEKYLNCLWKFLAAGAIFTQPCTLPCCLVEEIKIQLPGISVEYLNISLVFHSCKHSNACKSAYSFDFALTHLESSTHSLPTARVCTEEKIRFYQTRNIPFPLETLHVWKFD